MSTTGTPKTAAEIQKDWDTNPRWKGTTRNYTADEVVSAARLVEEHTLARRGAEKLWEVVNDEPYVNALGALTGNQAVQQVRAGLKAIYLSGWQVAADANTRRPDVPRPDPLPGQLGADGRAPHQQRAAARRPDRSGRRARATSTTSRRSWPTPRPASAACSTPSS